MPVGSFADLDDWLAGIAADGVVVADFVETHGFWAAWVGG